MRFVFLGAPGAGKGTLAKILAEEISIRHISTGSILREQIKAGTDLGKEAESYIESGDLVPDKLVSDMLAEFLKNGDVDNGYILDGYPRTLAQAEYLDEFLNELNTPLDAVVLVEIPEESIIERLTSRLTCMDCGAIFGKMRNQPKVDGVCDSCGGKLGQRDDDKEEVIRQRLQTYEQKTKPLIQFYEDKNILLRVDNTGSPEEAVAALRKMLNKQGNS